MRTRAQRTGVLCVAAALAFVAGGSTQSAATPQRTAAASAVSLDGVIAKVRFTTGGVLHGNPNPACGGAPFLSANALGAGAVQVEQFSPAASGLALAPPSNTFGSVFFGSSEDAVRQLDGLLDLTVAATGLRVSLHFTVVGGDCTHGMAESRQYVAGAGLTTPPSAGFQPIANACGTGQFTRPAASTYEVELSLVSCPSSPPTNPGCAPYIVIDSRGSGSNEVVSAPGKKFLDELRRLKAPQYVGVIRTEYPAVGWTSFLGAVLQLPAGYYKSVSTGSTWLRAKLASEIKLCGPKTKFFLTGYSQGAQIAGDVYQRNSYPQVLGVALFGDPYFNNRDSYVDRGDFRAGLGGNLGTRPFFDAARRRHVLSFCHDHDPVCQGPLSYFELIRYGFSRHNNYATLDEPERAARYFAGLG